MKKKPSPHQVYENERALRGPVIYKCDGYDGETDCTWQGRQEQMANIVDLDERVAVGELMAAGQCPNCGNMFSVHDDEVPYHTIMHCVEIAKKNGLL